MLDNLVQTKESIKAMKDWALLRGQHAQDICGFLRDRVERATEFVSKLTVIYLANDILHHRFVCCACHVKVFFFAVLSSCNVKCFTGNSCSAKRRSYGETNDLFGMKLKPHLQPMLISAHNGQPPEKQQKLLRVCRFPLFLFVFCFFIFFFEVLVISLTCVFNSCSRSGRIRESMKRDS